MRVRESLTGGYLGSILLRAFNGILLFVVSIVLSRLLGPADYGAYGVILSVATLLAIPFTAGLPRAMTRDIARAMAKDDPGLVHRTIRLGQLTFVCLLPFLAIFALALWSLNVKIAGLSSGILIAALLAPLLAADSNRIAIMQGLGQAVRSQVPDLLARPLATLGIVLSLLFFTSHVGAVGGAAAYAGSTLFGFAIGYLMLRPILGTIPRTPAKTEIRWPVFLGSVGSLSILGSTRAVTSNLDILLVNSLSTLSNAGLYKVAMAGLALVAAGNAAINSVTYTRLAAVVPKGDTKAITFHTDRTLLLSAGSSFLCVLGLLVVGKPLIQLLYGSEYLGSWEIALILSIGFATVQLFGSGENLAMLSGKQIAASGAILLGILSTVVLAVVLNPTLGAPGIALASAIGSIVREAMLALVVRRTFGVDITVLGLVKRRLAPQNDQQS